VSAAPPQSTPPRSRLTPAEVVARAKGELHYGAKVVLDAHLAPPPHDARARRFLWGFALPFGVLRAVLRDPAMRKRWLEVTSAQVGIIAVLSFFAVRFSDASIHHIAAMLATIYSVVCVVEWIVIAFSREYHDDLSRMAAYATSVPGEPPLPHHPRVHIDIKWLWKKLKRRIRGFALIASGAPLLAWVLFVPHVGDAIYAVLAALWAFYWLSVFALGATPLAWDERPPVRAPWFLRPFDSAAKVAVVGWPFGAYAWLWRKLTVSVHAPCETQARAAYEGAGLALARAITGFPGLYLFLRPLFPVAATHVVLARYTPPPP
jgi:hypothetical protein